MRPRMWVPIPPPEARPEPPAAPLQVFGRLLRVVLRDAAGGALAKQWATDDACGRLAATMLDLFEQVRFPRHWRRYRSASATRLSCACGRSLPSSTRFARPHLLLACSVGPLYLPPEALAAQKVTEKNRHNPRRGNDPVGTPPEGAPASLPALKARPSRHAARAARPFSMRSRALVLAVTSPGLAL